MNKKWLSYVLVGLFAAMLLWLPQAERTEASSDSYMYWGEVQSAEYAPLHAYTLNWTGDVLDRGGMNLSSLQQTTSSSEADIVMNQYGSIGARNVVKLSSRDLQERTSVYQQGGLQSMTMTQGDMYLLSLSSGTYAKMRIDQIRTDKVMFSFVLEVEGPTPTATPATTAPATTAPATTNPPTGSASGSQQETSDSKGTGSSADSLDGTSAGSSQSSDGAAPATAQEITLTIGQKRASINGGNTQLNSAPIVKSGVTLVPLRFIAESIGAKVNWDGREQRITLKLDEKTIVLQVNSKVATINGVRTTLLAAPMIEDGTTLVPIRFISENFDMKVNYNASTGSITITSKGSSSASNGASHSNGSGTGETNSGGNSTTGSGPGGIPSNPGVTKYYGSWSLWIEGGAMKIYNPATGEYVGHRYDSGADGGTLTINSNGTYTLKTYAVTQTGTWRAADDNEVYGYNGGIILEASGGKEAWAMYGTPSGKTALAQDSGGVYTDGSKIWIIQFILDKVK